MRGLVAHRIEARNELEEFVQLGMRLWVVGDLEKRTEDVVQVRVKADELR